MNRTRIAALALAAAFLFALPAQADDGHYGLNGTLNNVWGYGSSGSLYGLGHIPIPPYFALHPPVYYAEPVYRSYGASPYAWRGYKPTIYQPQAQEIMNPHAVIPMRQPKPAAPKAETNDRTAGNGQMIINPYFDASVVAKK